MSFGGSNIRPEATGYGLIYYVAQMLEHYHATFPSSSLSSFKGTRVLVSGSGNVAQFAALKLIELGAIVLSLSDSTGALISTEESVGFSAEDVHAIAALKLKHQSLTAFVQAEGVEKRFEWHAGKRPWELVKRIDIALPCATQNEVNGVEANALIAAGAKIVGEGSNMGCTLEAIEAFEKSRAGGAENVTWYAPGKASKCVAFF
jgi:glutamate dehydrogenase (NADP+)